MQEESSWSARSRGAARTNELDADERRRIIGSEEESFPVWLFMKGRVLVLGVWLGGVVSQAPIRRRANKPGGAMTMCPGTGLLSQMIEPGRWPLMPLVRACPGLGDPPGLQVWHRSRLCHWCTGVVSGSSAAWAAASRWPACFRAWRSRVPAVASYMSMSSV